MSLLFLDIWQAFAMISLLSEKTSLIIPYTETFAGQMNAIQHVQLVAGHLKQQIGLFILLQQNLSMR